MPVVGLDLAGVSCKVLDFAYFRKDGIDASDDVVDLLW